MEIYNKLFKTLKQDDLILTPNKHLIGFFNKSYAIYKQRKNKTVWSTPQILPLETWIILQWEKQLLQSAIFPYRLLTNNQEQLIWQTIIEKSTTHFLMPHQIAKTAQQAWQLNYLWQLDYTASQYDQTCESRIWKKWAANFIAFCRKRACIDLPRATTLLINLFEKKRLKPPRRLFLIGFDEINPQNKKLIAALKQAGCEIAELSFTESKPYVRRLVLQTIETELETMARWAHQTWQAGKKNIICVVPNLMTIRSQVIATFTDVFTHLNQTTTSPLPFNIASGKKLSEFSSIQTALMILQMKTIDSFERVSKLIRSPYIGAAEEEQSYRAQLDVYCRRNLESTIGLEQLVSISQQQYCPQFGQLINNFLVLCSPATKQLPSQWAIYFAEKLNTFAWPGQRQLGSEEFQLLERWSKLLHELSGLDFILGKTTEGVAFQQLKYLADDSLFQAKLPYEPSINLLGLLDTSGLYCDNLWIMGLDAQSWPAAARPNPFIPYSIQRTHALPHSSSERESYFSSLITKRLLKSAHTIIVSHSLETSSSEQRLRPSVLINNIPTIEINELALPKHQNIIESIWSTRSWEYYCDDKAPSLHPNELTSIGTQLFKSQAACPFQAFALFRLHSYFYPLPGIGLNSIDRGILLHNAIETLWNFLTDQTILLKQSDQSLQQIIQKAITLVIKKLGIKRPFTLKSQFIEIEQERLQQCLMKLIALEKKRLPFNKVTHEKKQKFILGKLPLNLRIDRLDTLSDGTTLIIDYKTGTPVKFNWFEERLDEPQLALYCLSQPAAKGFAIIHIRSNTIEIQGLSEKENGLSQVISVIKDKNMPKTLAELLAFWKTALEKLAKQFQEGVASVDPKKGINTCRFCQLPLFCRINHHEKP